MGNDTLASPLTILIPAYKPDMKLKELCDQLLTHEGLEIVVVDDGSGEETGQTDHGVTPPSRTRACRLRGYPRGG